jgi:hypothetical protein
MFEEKKRSQTFKIEPSTIRNSYTTLSQNHDDFNFFADMVYGHEVTSKLMSQQYMDLLSPKSK